MQTDEEIEDIIYHYLKETELASEVNGTIYKNGERPAGRQSEDIVIHVLANVVDSVQKAIVLVNIYTQDVKRDDALVRNDKRFKQLAQLGKNALEWVNQGINKWKVEEQTSIDAETDEHIIQFKLIYKHLNSN